MKFFLYNLENFFLTFENVNLGLRKAEEKIQEIKSIIQKEDPDILMLLEIGGIDSLYLFNTKYLESKYQVYIMPGNSDRGIEMGYLVKKTLPFDFEIKSHINREIENPSQKIFGNKELLFSRDISELRILSNGEIKLIFLLVHLKSKWDRDGNDPGGFLRRRSELNSLVKLYNEYQKQMPNTPTIVCGDFNGNAQKNSYESEFSNLYTQTDLIDALDLLQITNDDRFTYFQFNREGKRLGFQLDYIFLPESLVKYIQKENSGVYRYQTAQNLPYVPPQTMFERASLPSDHFPVILSLDFLK